MILFTNPSARAGYDTRSIFKRSLTGFNLEFSLSVKDDERCGRRKEVNTPELIGQSVRLKVRVTMLRF